MQRLNKMLAARFSEISLLLLLTYTAFSSAVTYPSRTQRPSSGVYANRLCSPPYGFRPNACGSREVISEFVEPACEYLWGPNVCLFTVTIQSNVLEYRYHQGCDWVYSHYYYTWVQQCSYVCQPTSVCLEETQVFNRTFERCCPGFAARPPQTGYNVYSQYYHYSYYTPIRKDPLGCPVAVAESLLQCLEIQGLTEFVSYINISDYLNLLNSTTDTHLSLFAPTNAAVVRARERGAIPSIFNTFLNLSNVVGNHLVRGNVTMESLQQPGAKIYTNLEKRNLHRVSIFFSDYSFLTYDQSPYQSSVFGAAKDIITPFINGAQVVIENACNTVNGTLHIIDWVLSPAQFTIAFYLRNNESFSMFTAGLETVGLLEFLDNPNVSRTVFAIPNDAFVEALPSALMMCMSFYMRLPFNNLLLFHIGSGAHYSSSLSRNNFFYTLLQKFIEVEVDSDGTIYLGRCRVPIIDRDVVSASNGVIHVVERVLFPEDFSFGMCDAFIPSPSPVECPSPSPSPTMVPTPSAEVMVPSMMDPVILPSMDPPHTASPSMGPPLMASPSMDPPLMASPGMGPPLMASPSPAGGSRSNKILSNRPR